jgi:hypothetical protein
MGCITALIKVVVITVVLLMALGAAQGPPERRSPTVMWVSLGIAAVLGLNLLRTRPSRCSMCRNPLRRTTYKWKIDGRRRYLCPHCNQRMERQQSADAFGDFKSRRR